MTTQQEEARASILNLREYLLGPNPGEARKQVRKLLQFLYISLLEHRTVGLGKKEDLEGQLGKDPFHPLNFP